MIGTIDIAVNAQHPNVPLAPVFVWRGSASRINVEGVPSLCGSWYVSAVSIAVATPDGKTVNYPCQRTSNGIYAATIEATETPGKSANGITITATDEAEKGFVLGRGDLYILDGAAIPSPGDVSWTIRLLSSKPEIPKDGDAYFEVDGTLMVFSGGAWRNTMPASVPLVVDSYGVKTAVTIGSRSGIVGPYSLANGSNVNALGVYSHAEGRETTASGVFSHAEGYSTTASVNGSHSEGSGTTASAFYSHAEGSRTTASGDYSHAEGVGTKAEGFGSHAEGRETTASGDYSHAEGFQSQTKTEDNLAYSWNGDGTRTEPYFSHGKGTFNINPVGGTDGFYIGEKKLSEVMSDGVSDKADKTSLAPEYSPSSAYAVGSFVFNDGNIYQCTTAIADGGEAWNAAHWELRKLDDFFTNSNSLLTATIDARLPYPLYAVPSTGLLKDRALNTTSLASVTVPDNFTDLLIRASVASSLSVTMPEAITTKYGDTFPGESGEYLITITKTGAAEAYVRTIKLEVANA